MGGVAACLVAVVLLSLFSEEFAAAGKRGTAALAAYGLPVARVAAEIAAALCAGALLLAAFLVPAKQSGELSDAARTAMRTASWSAVVWCVAALLSVPFVLADAYGRPLSYVLELDRLVRLSFAVEPTRAWMLTAAVAIVLAVTARSVKLWRSTPVLLVVALLNLVPVASSGHSSEGGNHDWATSSLLMHLVAAALWVGGLAALLAYGRQKGEHLGLAASRFSRLALVCWLVLAASGVFNALVRLRLSEVFTTAYGMLVIAKGAALAALGVFGYFQRKRGVRDVVEKGSGRALVQLAAFEVLLMMMTLGLATALSRTPPPPSLGVVLPDIELRIGYVIDGPPTLLAIFTQWRFDLILGTAAMILAVVYLLGVRRLREPWPVFRTVSWLGGCATILLASSSGIGRYAPAMFSTDMIGNILLAMLAAIPLVQGAPFTLISRAAPGLREWLTMMTQAPVVRLLTHPAVVLVLFNGSFYALYFSGLFEWAQNRPLTQMGTNVWLLATGFLFFWAVLAVDSFPTPIPLRHRRIMLVTATAAHALFAAILVSTSTVIGEEFYRSLGLAWNTNLLDSQRLGGAVAFGFGVGALLLVTLVLFTQPARPSIRADQQRDAADQHEMT
ncbi:putative copper resistance protein D [Kibdelosporangium banguiense]|uniref:Copper resistance protein D n=1 Tax=Kibdelosporangium banguiense TaxID=1365924 RepID=A0ABS4U250_9PSEU|nr:cytochrome c oxidase assembly protein [Kibdelosporangium banguiense]MBP2330700.1 putative copper resistance protein D [Kibdelosporangium banguiense]